MTALQGSTKIRFYYERAEPTEPFEIFDEARNEAVGVRESLLSHLDRTTQPILGDEGHNDMFSGTIWLYHDPRGASILVEDTDQSKDNYVGAEIYGENGVRDQIASELKGLSNKFKDFRE